MIFKEHLFLTSWLTNLGIDWEIKYEGLGEHIVFYESMSEHSLCLSYLKGRITFFSRNLNKIPFTWKEISTWPNLEDLPSIMEQIEFTIMQRAFDSGDR